MEELPHRWLKSVSPRHCMLVIKIFHRVFQPGVLHKFGKDALIILNLKLNASHQPMICNLLSARDVDQCGVDLSKVYRIHHRPKCFGSLVTSMTVGGIFIVFIIF